MALDEHASALITSMNEQGAPQFRNMSPEDVRAAVETFTGMQLAPQKVAGMEQVTYSGPGGDLGMNLYVPSGTGPFPVVVYFHGGGFVGGSLNVVDEPARALANDAGAIVVTAQYRLAPDHKFPAATDDTMAALAWVVENIQRYRGNPDRIFVMGDSAGGNLAAVAALRARDEGGPQLAGQILIYPVIDTQARFPSREEFFEGYVITAPDLDWFWAQYLNSMADAENPYATPTKASSLANLPPALVVSTEYEVSRDEAEDYARRLTEAGVEVTQKRIDGLMHGSYWMSAVIPRSAEIHNSIVEFVKSA